MSFVEFSADDYNRILNWFTLAFAKKQNYDVEDRALCEKIRVLARELLREKQEEEDEGKNINKKD